MPERHPKAPTSPCGNTKMVVEMALEDLPTAERLRAVSLPHSDAAGATDRRRERHDPETYLIPLALRVAIRRNPLKVFGTDYPTPDGTAIRDDIYVNDLVSAHLLAIAYLRNAGGTVALSLGAGLGQACGHGKHRSVLHQSVRLARQSPSLTPRRQRHPYSLWNVPILRRYTGANPLLNRNGASGDVSNLVRA